MWRFLYLFSKKREGVICMNLIDKEVMHRQFGKGIVVGLTDSCIEVRFESGNKRFVFPDAFGTYLILLDKKAAASVKRLKAKREEELKKEELLHEQEKLERQEEILRYLHREKLLKNLKIHPSSQAAFWCDEEEQGRVFADWQVTTGFIKSGTKKGQIATINRLNKNSACVFTFRAPGIPEKERRIIGLYMVTEDFIGKLCQDGIIPAHPEYRIRLTPEESGKMLFWNYYRNDKYPNKIVWNAGKYRYLDNIWVAQMLKDIVSLKTDAEEKKLAKRFLEYYCDLNRIEIKELPNPEGELLRA